MKSNQDEVEHCPYCNDIGWYATRDPTEVWVQLQCEFCYIKPNSWFNIQKLIEKLKADEGNYTSVK